MSRKKILVVEDETLQLTMVAKRLKAAGYDVLGAIFMGFSGFITRRQYLRHQKKCDRPMVLGD